jgi:hypothetical protein
LPMESPRRNEEPAAIFDQADYIPDLHAIPSRKNLPSRKI